MSEMKFTRKVCDLLEKDGCEIYPLVAQTMGKHGWPDRLVVSRHGLFLFEFKGKDTKLQVRQRMVMQKCNKRAMCCFVLREPDWAVDLVKGREILARLAAPDEQHYFLVRDVADLWRHVLGLVGKWEHENTKQKMDLP